MDDVPRTQAWMRYAGYPSGGAAIAAVIGIAGILAGMWIGVAELSFESFCLLMLFVYIPMNTAGLRWAKTGLRRLSLFACNIYVVHLYDWALADYIGTLDGYPCANALQVPIFASIAAFVVFWVLGEIGKKRKQKDMF